MLNQLKLSPVFNLQKELYFNFTDFKEGNHTFGVRVRNQNSEWSLTKLTKFELTPATAIQSNQLTEIYTKIYPNPTTGHVRCEITSSELSEIDVLICDLMGRKILEKRIETQGSFSLDLSKLNIGVYFIKLIGNNSYEHNQLIIKQ